MSPQALAAPSTHRLAVFVDIENVAGYCSDMKVPVDIASVLTYLEQHYGRVQIKRSFGDISSLPSPHFQPYKIRRMLQSHQVDHQDIPHRPGNYSKNSADIRLVVDAVALIHERPEITHVVVLSNDRDFIPLFNHAREHGKVVIGCGPARSTVNEDYRNACDVFVFLEDLVETAKPPPATIANATNNLAPPQAPLQAPLSTPNTSAPLEFDTLPNVDGDASDYLSQLRTAVHFVQGQGGPVTSSRVANCMRDLFPEIDIKKEFGSFKTFCLAYEKSGDIVIRERHLPNFFLEIASPAPASAAAVVMPEEAPAQETTQQTTQDPTPVPTPAPAPTAASLIDQYRDWVVQKLKVPPPPLKVRQCVFEAVLQTLKSRPTPRSPIALRELSIAASAQIHGMVEEADTVAFRVCYGLYRSKAFFARPTDNAFNPDITGLIVQPEALDNCFFNNTWTTFSRDAQHGLPLEIAVMRQLFEMDLAAPAASELEEAPAHVAEKPQALLAEEASAAYVEEVPTSVVEEVPALTVEDAPILVAEDAPLLVPVIESEPAAAATKPKAKAKARAKPTLPNPAEEVQAPAQPELAPPKPKRTTRKKNNPPPHGGLEFDF